ncbi:hypothetical protein CLV78_11334 [Aliiruegeria haliotis]|uniref:Uncharacterized protein n=1 Tax=Aliiruegeria haliotis TaxID=1280846 RepID=A0A2T0RGZ1_9RHOB|nr:hypothetical protein CLV78_11334 [Aliiruegeria haliotis]
MMDAFIFSKVTGIPALVTKGSLVVLTAHAGIRRWSTCMLFSGGRLLFLVAGDPLLGSERVA